MVLHMRLETYASEYKLYSWGLTWDLIPVPAAATADAEIHCRFIECLWFIDYEVSLEEENIPYAAGRKEDSPNKNGCGTTHTVTQKNNTSCPHFKLGYIKTHYLVTAIFKPPLFVYAYNKLKAKCYRSRILLWIKVLVYEVTPAVDKNGKSPSSPGWQTLFLPPCTYKHWCSSAYLYTRTLLGKGHNPLGNNCPCPAKIVIKKYLAVWLHSNKTTPSNRKNL